MIKTVTERPGKGLSIKFDSLVYTFNDGQRIEKEVRIEQEAGKEPGTGGEDPSGADFNYTATGFSGSNYGVSGMDDSYDYEVTLKASDGIEYILDIYSLASPAPVGNFVYVDAFWGLSDGQLSYYTKAQGKDVEFGTLVITDNGDETYTYIADLVDIDGNKHHVEYRGPVSF